MLVICFCVVGTNTVIFHINKVNLNVTDNNRESNMYHNKGLFKYHTNAIRSILYTFVDSYFKPKYSKNFKF